MYITDATLLNSGPIADVELKAPFNADGTPKPIILVGANGSGKTTLLSVLADALHFLASQHFNDIAPEVHGIRTPFLRMLGGINMRIGAPFEVAAVRFIEEATPLYYRSKSGNVPPDTLAARVANYSQFAKWPNPGNVKDSTKNEKLVRPIFETGCYAFFPSSRHEHPHWLNDDAIARDPAPQFRLSIEGKLGKPIFVESGMEQLKPWLIDVILDQAIDASVVMNANDLGALRARTIQQLINSRTLLSFNRLLQTVLDRPDAHAVRLHRAYAGQRLAIQFEHGVGIPSYEHLSAGQATLLALFGTVLRYAEHQKIGTDLSDFAGIVLVDEIDAHLHSDLQYRALPALMKLFPRIQFVASSHAPIFLLGMRETFGEDGFDIIEMPSGLTIDVEQFAEFERSFAYFRETSAFRELLRKRLAESAKPLILCEGETDPRYLTTAMRLLGFDNLANTVDVDWPGIADTGGAKGGGVPGLDAVVKLLERNPQLSSRSVMVIYDADVGRVDRDAGNIRVRSLHANPQNTVVPCGIENLLPPDVIEQRFFIEKRRLKPSGGYHLDVELDKSALCNYVCNERRNPADFEKFAPMLKMIRATLVTP